MSDKVGAQVDRYTVSYSFDTNRGGQKASHFVSFGFTLPHPVPVEEAEALAMKSSMSVTKSAVYQGLARGAITVEEANEILLAARENHEHLIEKMAAAAKPAVSGSAGESR